MFIHDVIKIKYIREGYLPNYPYHLTTDREMIQAFMYNTEIDSITGESLPADYFHITYPCNFTSPDLKESYNELTAEIDKILQKFLEDGSAIPDWVYSYMLGVVVGPSSSAQDISDLVELLGIPDATYGEFSEAVSERCLSVSRSWVNKVAHASSKRCPTIFGEPHVIKSLRLDEVNVLE